MSRIEHNTVDDILLYLELSDPETGLPLTGQSPTLTIRRFRDPHGALMDGHFWDGAAFQAGAQNLAMVEWDSTNNPGLYYYLFEQSLIGVETEYLVDFTVAAGPAAGLHDVEYHVVTSEEDVEISTGSPFDPGGVLP